MRYLLPFLAMLLCLDLAAAPTPDPVVLRLPLDGSVVDASTCENEAVLQGNEAWVGGQAGQALWLDGTAGVNVRPSGSLHLDDHSWTVELWIKPAASMADGTAIFFAGGWGNLRQYGLRLVRGCLGAWHESGSTRAIEADRQTSAVLFDGAWHRIALVIDRARHGELRLYLDGRRIPVAAPVLAPPIQFESGTMGVCLGAIAPWYIGKPGAYVGGIDELRIADTVLPDYATDDPPPPPPPAPAARTPFEFDPAASATPLAITPENTLIALNDGIRESNISTAGTLLSTTLRQAYGVTSGFDVVDEGAVPADLTGRIVLALGPTRWLAPEATAGLFRDGFVIKRQAGVVAICGGQSTGTLYGAIRFLDQVAGIRFYMPTDLWISTPAATPLTLPPNLDLRLEPFVRSASLSGLVGIPGDRGWATLSGASRRLGGTHQHSLWHRFPPSRYAETHPTVYAIVKGERRLPSDSRDQEWNLCFTDPATLEAAVDSAHRYFRQQPGHLYLAFSIMDSHTMCECDRCLAEYRALAPVDTPDARERGHSAVFWRFMNRLAERLEPTLPDRKLVALAYSVTRFVPPFKLHPNVVVFANFHIAELDADRFLVPGDNGVSLLDQWLNVSTTFGNHDWYQGNGYLIPRLYTPYWSRFMQALQAKLPGGVLQHCECYPNWGLDGPKYYLMNRLWWEPSLDPEPLWQQFCQDMFGPAAEPMRDYFRRLEALWVTLDNVKGPERKLSRWSTQFKTDADDLAVIAACRADLDRALGLAATPDQLARIGLFSKTFLLSERLCQFAAAESVTQAQIDELKSHAAELASDPMTLFGAGQQPAGLLGKIGDAIAAVTAGKVR